MFTFSMVNQSVITVAYSAPDTKVAMNFVQDIIHKQQTTCLEAALRVTCDLNQINSPT